MFIYNFLVFLNKRCYYYLNIKEYFTYKLFNRFCSFIQFILYYHIIYLSIFSILMIKLS